MPQFSDDDYLNFIVLEALVARGEQDRKDSEQSHEAEAFRKSHKDWDPHGGP